jgi:hypothetical protein
MKQLLFITHTINQTEIPVLLDSWVTNTGQSQCCVHKKLHVLIFPYKPNMLKCWSIKDWSSFFCLLQNCVCVGYDNFLFHEQYTILLVYLWSI